MLIYISNARLPTLMAHGLQIVENCEAFADAGATVSLWCARRYIPSSERHLDQDIWAHYGVKRNFKLRRLFCLDLTFWLQYFTFSLVAAFMALFTRADIYYSRDPLTLFLLGFIKPRAKLIYEAHRLNNPGKGAWLQAQVLKRCAVTVAITPPLAEGLAQLQADSAIKSQIIIAHDGIRAARFANLPTQAEARAEIGWSSDVFIVGYVGRLKTLGMEKGLDTLIDAIALLKPSPIALAIVGGPEAMVQGYRDQWQKHGLDETLFLYAGQVNPARVPLYLSAFDVCALPSPPTQQFSYYTSPLKLFEYMASERAIIASDLPGWRDVLTHGEHGLLVLPSDTQAFADAILRLQADSALRLALAKNARQRVMSAYTWEVRTQRILKTAYR